MKSPTITASTKGSRSRCDDDDDDDGDDGDGGDDDGGGDVNWDSGVIIGIIITDDMMTTGFP